MKSCAICQSRSRPMIDRALASTDASSPRLIARRFPRFTRSMITRHRSWCLRGIPRLIFSLQSGAATEEEARQRLLEEGNDEASVEYTLRVAREVIGGAV